MGKDSKMAKRPAMTKSPMLLAKIALKTAQEVLTPYSDLRSRHDFTQAQIFAILTLRQFFKTDYRGIIRILQEHRNIKEVLGLNKLPHFTTVQKAQQRMLKKTSLPACLQKFLIMQDTAA
jgi:ribosomal protein L30/L7E